MARVVTLLEIDSAVDRCTAPIFAASPESETMQLRVARLCLDCEELHTDNTCPRCASESYAFLSAWLPVDDRRRWRRPVPNVAKTPWWSETPRDLVKSLGRWLAGDPPPAPPGGPMTRAADRAAQMNFDKEGEVQREKLDIRLSKPGVRKL